VNALADLVRSTKKSAWLVESNFFEKAKAFFEATKAQKNDEMVEHFYREFFPQEMHGNSRLQDLSNPLGNYFNIERNPQPLFDDLDAIVNAPEKQKLREQIREAAIRRDFVSDDVAKFYFSRAVELERSQLVDINLAPPSNHETHPRVDVVDLPSIDNSRHQKMAVCTFLEAEWRRAREDWEKALGEANPDADTRVSTFIVVEEAHNAIPVNIVTAADKLLQEQFRRISAEGRKYGLFLILVSQRPDKLDLVVMSECENRVIMKVGSRVVLTKACEILGVDDGFQHMTAKVMEFDVGRALLFGPWVNDEPTFLVSAARRTIEGGRNLREEFWTQPEA
jgi:hypothetical protein